MIACQFHEGSGLGNQLARYVACRVLAKDKGFEFGVINPENFKGKSFMQIDMGVPVKGLMHEFNEGKVTNDQGVNITPYNADLLNVEDFTLIDGEFQDPRYFIHRIDDIREWLKVESPIMSATTCVINFRGGEYVGVKDLFLPKEYWNLAKKYIEIKHGISNFEIHTDDIKIANELFPDYLSVHDIELNWCNIRYAMYLILSNSSFAILPALLNENAKTIIAPKYWAGYNKGYWQLPQNQYEKFNYIHHNE